MSTALPTHTNMKSFFIPSIDLYIAIRYISCHDKEMFLCLIQSLCLYPKSTGLSSSGNQEKQGLLESLKVSAMTIWRSLTVLTGNPRSQPKFSLLLSHYWQSKNNSPALSQVVEGRPLTQLKTVGVIWMISNISMPVKRSGELLHIFGGV